MNAAHLHLLVNHVSPYALFFGLIALLVFMRRGTVEFRIAATTLFVLAGVFAWIAFLTGEGAEEVVEALGTASHDLIEQHEQAAAWARGSGTLVALLAIAMEWATRRQKKFAKALRWALVLFSLHGLTVYLATSYLGGQISHPELRPADQSQISE